MSTRGIVGVRIDGTDKMTYNHFDSYPSSLGVIVLKDTVAMMNDWGLEKMKEQARALKLVNNDVPPTEAEIASLAQFSNLDVGEQSDADWYCILRDVQGKLRDYLTIGYMEDSDNFIIDSLFCEWGYIINLDDGVLEIYEGVQKSAHDLGRFGNLGDGEYYGCALIRSYPLDSLPDESEIITLEGLDEED